MYRMMFSQLSSVKRIPIVMSSDNIQSSGDKSENSNKSQKFYSYSLQIFTQELIDLKGLFEPNEYVIYDSKHVYSYPNFPVKVQFSGNLSTVISDFNYPNQNYDEDDIYNIITDSKRLVRCTLDHKWYTNRKDGQEAGGNYKGRKQR